IFIVEHLLSGSDTMIRLPSTLRPVMRCHAATYAALVGALLTLAVGCSLQSPPLPPPCYGPDNGQGTVDLPPSCGLGPIGPINTPIITNGLNPGDSIILIDVNLLNLTPSPIMPGGMLGGDTQHSQGNLDVHLGGTGTLSGWDLHVPIRVDCQIDAAARPYFAPQQNFNVQIQGLAGGLLAPTPDFNQLM